MELMIIYILTVYFGIGAVAVWFINRKRDHIAARNGWIKYLVYLAVVLTVIITLQNFLSREILFALILIVSACELIYVSTRKNSGNPVIKAIGTIIFMALGYGFWLFGKHNGISEVLFTYLIVFSFDGFAQISGQLFGRRKLVSTISPEKTVAGLAGGLLMGTLTGVIVIAFFSRFYFNFTFTAITSLIICFAAFLGDLFASYYKRVCGVKDYSNLIPGHGGFLDRFDSFIAAGAVNYFLTTLLNYINAGS